MQVNQVLGMKAGTGTTSYAQNSLMQRCSLAKTEPLLEECVREICSKFFLDKGSSTMMVADLGCASGPNSLSIISSITTILTTSTTTTTCGGIPSQVAVFLNDLPQNDFNSIFQMLSSTTAENEKKKIPCFVSATPGSFYGRLFPDNFLHFVRSNSCLHWLSQVPEGLIGEDGQGLNKGCLHLHRGSPPKVAQLYSLQFNKDFTSFLRHRSKEVLAGGRMFLTFNGRPSNIVPDNGIMDLASQALSQMVHEGLINQAQLDRFNVPLYTATIEEIKEAITVEGSFTIHRLETFSISWDAPLKISNEGIADDPQLGISMQTKVISNTFRAAMESLFTAEFGDDMTNDLFKRLDGIINDYFKTGKTIDGIFRLVVSLVKNDSH